MRPSVDQIIRLYAMNGNSQYGGEAVSQLEHALQSAALAERERACPELIAAALLHDVGHLLHDLPVDAPDAGIDDHHESSAAQFLAALFPEAVTDPIRLHVAAKRYLCATDPTYLQTLSQPSVVSLKLQGGPMTKGEIEQFRRHPSSKDAVRLRHWDDAAKVPNQTTPSLTHFATYLFAAARKAAL